MRELGGHGRPLGVGQHVAEPGGAVLVEGRQGQRLLPVHVEAPQVGAGREQVLGLQTAVDYLREERKIVLNQSINLRTEMALSVKDGVEISRN